MGVRSLYYTEASLFSRIVALLCIFLCLLPLISAQSLPEEETSVSRIVGYSPSEMLRQLQRDSVEISSATYLSDRHYSHTTPLPESFGLLSEAFPDFSYDHLSDAEDKLSLLEQNEFLVVTYEDHDELDPADLRSWQSDIERATPLIVYDAPHAGTYLPKEDTIALRFVRDAPLIAPSAFSSPDFIQSVLCNAHTSDNLGTLMKEARNFHYTGGSKASSSNYLGLVLQSYFLYGNPKTTITYPHISDDYAKIYCKNNLENLAPDLQFLGTVGNYSHFRKFVTFSIPTYTVYTQEGYEFLNASPAYDLFIPGEPVLPFAARTSTFPGDAVFTNMTLTDHEFVSLTLDFPDFSGNYTNRSCYVDSQNFSVDFYDTFEQGNRNVVADIVPVDIVNCTSGDIRLYTSLNYTIDYLTKTPVLVSSVSSVSSVSPGELVPVAIVLEELGGDRNGSLVIKDADDSILWELEINSSDLIYDADFYAPQEEGYYTYSVEFLQENETKHLHYFSFVIKILDITSFVPSTARSTDMVNFTLFSYQNSSFDLTYSFSLFDNASIVSSGDATVTLDPGNNSIRLSFSSLERESQAYTLVMDFEYLGQSKTIQYLLTTNHPPLAYFSSNTALLFEEYQLNLTSFDSDDDALTIHFNDSRFVANESSFSFTPTRSDLGNHTVEATVSDGLLSSTASYTFSVSDINEAPEISMNSSYLFRENESIILVVVATDVNNDTLSYEINNSNFTFENLTSTFSCTNCSSDDLTLLISVSDDEFTTEHEVNVTINTQPTFISSTTFLLNQTESFFEFLDPYDSDNDTLNFSVNDSRFLIGNNSLMFTATETVENISILVSLSDPYFTVEKQFIVSVIDTCTPDWVAQNSSCLINDSIEQYYIDSLNCFALTNFSSDSEAPDTIIFADSCDYCTPDWVAQNSSCLINDSIEQYYIDSLNCFALTNLSSDSEAPDTIIFADSCDYCTPDWVAQNSSCLINDSIEQYYIDSLNCFALTNLSSDSEAPDTIIFADSCDYCTPDWVAQNSSCLTNDTLTQYFIDNQSCYNQTGLLSDTVAPDNVTLSCDYCTPNWIAENTSCLADDSIEQYYSDSLNCFALTNVSSDASAPANTSFAYSCDYCTPNETFIVEQNWSNVSSCLYGDYAHWERELLYYDSHYCVFSNTSEAEFQNYTQVENETRFCDYCTPELVNTSWTEWVYTSYCLENGTQQQNRSLVQYDSLFCDEVENVTFIENRYLPCEDCVSNLTYSNWTEWYNITTCYTNDTLIEQRNRTYLDYNLCVFVNESIEYEERIGVCDFCTPDIINSSWTPWTDSSSCVSGKKNQTRNKTEFDSLYCNETNDTIYTQEREVVCLSCVSQWNCTAWEVPDGCSGNMTRTCTDLSNCSDPEFVPRETYYCEVDSESEVEYMDNITSLTLTYPKYANMSSYVINFSFAPSTNDTNASDSLIYHSSLFNFSVNQTNFSLSLVHYLSPLQWNCTADDSYYCSFTLFVENYTHFTYTINSNSTDYPVFPLDEGWNLLSFNPSERIDEAYQQNLSVGWNFFFYPNKEPYFWNHLIVTKNGSQYYFSEALANGYFQGSLYYIAGSTFKQVPLHDTFFRYKQGYWIYSRENVTLDVQGSPVDEPEFTFDLYVTNGSLTYNRTDASSFVKPEFYQYDTENSSYMTINSTYDLDLDSSYWVYSYTDSALIYLISHNVTATGGGD